MLPSLIIYFLERIGEVHNKPYQVVRTEMKLREARMKAPKPTTQLVPAEDRDPVKTGEQVRTRAYELFEARGGEAGHELEDWLRAEEEVTGQKSRAAAA